MLKHSVLIDENLYNEINEYCKANGIKVSGFCNKELRKAIALEKYGDMPFGKIRDTFPPYEERKPQIVAEPIVETKKQELEKAITEFGEKLTSVQFDLDPQIAQLIDDNFFDLIADTPSSIETVEETEKKIRDIMAVPSERLNQEDKPQPRKRRL